jgi:hypothetical protein
VTPSKKQILWKPRDYERGDEHALIALTGIALERKIGLDGWNWLFADNPAGQGIFSLADHDGRIVGQYVVIPIRMLVKGQVITGAQSMDTMTHPDYRRQGMFTTLAKEVYGKLRSPEIPVAYGFPNDASHPGFVGKLSWITLTDLPIILRPLRLSSLLSSRVKIPLITRVFGFIGQRAFDLIYRSRDAEETCTISRIPSFDNEFDSLWQHVKKGFTNVVIRDSIYLNWRYVAKPNGGYETFAARDNEGALRGYTVLKKIEKEGLHQGLIVDLLTDDFDQDTAECLFDFAIRHFREKNMDLIACIMLSDAPYRALLRKKGFIFTPKTLPYIVRTNTDRFRIEELRDVNDWYVTFGDSDFV